MQHFAKFDVPRYLHEKRLRKRKNRLRRELRSAKRNSDRRTVESMLGTSSKVLEMIAGACSAVGRQQRKGRVAFTAPKNFSLLENPSETLASISRFAADCLTTRLKAVYIDLSKTTVYDAGANGLLDVVVDEVETLARKAKRKIHWSGVYPADEKLKRLVKALGVIKFLEVKHEFPKKKEASMLEVFEVRCKHYVRAVRANETDKKSRTTQKFADHVNECLGRVGRQLTAQARHLLCAYVTEVLDNAEEHSLMYDWTIQGYLDTHGKDWTCEIVLFNFGRSIADSLSGLPTYSYTWGMIAPYLLRHGPNFWNGRWRREDLLTLIALQQSVSWKNQSKADTRGNGTYDLIRFFQQMSDESNETEKQFQPKMMLISGTTQILFDGKYKMSPNSAGLGVLAFNSSNDLNSPPDPQYVNGLKQAGFPGTLLSIKFPLSPGHSSTAAVEGEASWTRRK